MVMPIYLLLYGREVTFLGGISSETQTNKWLMTIKNIIPLKILRRQIKQYEGV